MSKTTLLITCALLHTALCHGGHNHNHDHDVLETAQSTFFNILDKYVYTQNSVENAVVSSAILLLAPPLLMKLLPKRIMNPVMNSDKTLIFSLGSVLGELFVHVLPSLYEQFPDESAFKTDPVTTGIAIFTGYVIFYTLDKLILLVLSKYSGDEGVATHTHSHSVEKEEEQEYEEEQHTKEKVGGVEDADALSAYYLNLLSDTAHSFSDGILLFSSFKSSKKIGIATTVAILIHEIPHVMGDYALLNQKMGFSFFQCFTQQVFSTLGKLFGIAFNYFIFTKNSDVIASKNSNIPSVFFEPSFLQKLQSLTTKIIFFGRNPTSSELAFTTKSNQIVQTAPKFFNVLYSSVIFQKLPKSLQANIIYYTNINILQNNEHLLMALSAGTLFYMIFNNILPQISNPRGFKDLLLQLVTLSSGFIALFLL